MKTTCLNYVEEFLYIESAQNNNTCSLLKGVGVMRKCAVH